MSQRRRRPRRPRGPGPAALTIMVLAALAVALANVAIWADATALDSRSYSATVAPLADDEPVIAAVSDFAAAEVARRPELEAELRAALPERAEGLSGALSGGLAAAVRRAVPRVMRSDRFREVWREANRLTHAEALRIVRSDAAPGDGTLTLDLRPAVAAVLVEIGLSAELANDLPAEVGVADVVSERDLARARTGVGLLEGSARVLPLVALALLIGGLALARSGARIRAIGWAGLFVAIAAALTLVGLEVARDPVIGALAEPSAEGAAGAVWDTTLRGLDLRSWAIVAAGLVVVAGAAVIARRSGR